MWSGIEAVNCYKCGSTHGVDQYLHTCQPSRTNYDYGARLWGRAICPLRIPSCGACEYSVSITPSTVATFANVLPAHQLDRLLGGWYAQQGLLMLLLGLVPAMTRNP